ncbi:MAG: hypothetical protein ACRDSH_20915, partial [Pseudonocardiaceae bacterium]
VLVRAQDVAEQITTEARAEADRTLDHAQTHCAQVISDAHRRAEHMVNNARTRVETLLQEARNIAEALHRQAREKTAALELDTTRTRAETLAVLNHDKARLESTIDDLRCFEQEYRIQLALYLQLLIDELDGPAPTVGVDPLHPERDLVSVGLGTHGDAGQSPPG